MEEALSILWTYARRQPIESNGKTVVATISQSIAAIRLIMRLEGWLQKNKERVPTPAQSQFAQYKIDTPVLLVFPAPWKKKIKPSEQEPNHLVAKTSYHTSKPRKVSRQRPCVKNDKSPDLMSKPRKVSRQRPCVKNDKSPDLISKPRKVSPQRSVIKEGLYKEITLIESPMIGHFAADSYHRDYGERLISSRPPPFISEK